MTTSNSQFVLGVGAALSVLAAAFAAGCTEDFDSCTASRTCASTGGSDGSGAGEAGASQVDGKGGAGGSAGSGGKPSGGASGVSASGGTDDGAEGGASTGGSGLSEGGSGAAGQDDAGASGEGGDGAEQPASCDRDSDCDDGDACNGEETCELEACVPGTPVECTNAEPDHCVATCKTVDSVAECGHEGRDADEDGFKSAACTLNPGNDCDDDETRTHPGAAEMCDGVDSDCDMVGDRDEAEVEVSGEVTTLVAGSGVQRKIEAPNIAGRSEIIPRYENANDPPPSFAVAWTDWKADCSGVATATVARNGAVTIVRDSGCSFLAADVTRQPGILSLRSRLSSDTVEMNVGSSQASLPMAKAYSASYKDDEYRIIALVGSAPATTTRVMRYGYDATLQQTRSEEIDPAGEHIAIDGAHSEAIWTLRKSPTLDQVFASIGNELHTISDATTTASHPHMAWSSNHGIALAWRYGDGRMMFRHHQEACQEEIAHGFPGEIAATAKGFVLVSLSENKREIVANLIGPSCSIGPRAVLASLDEGSVDAFGEPKVAVTGSQIRAVWTHTSGDHTDLESRLFSWADCE